MRIVVPFFIALLSMVCVSAVAETSAPEAEKTSSKEISSVDQQAVKDLIGTLESDTERQALIDNLRLMVDQQPEPHSGLMNVIAFDSSVSGFTNKLLALMESNGISQNLLGDIITRLFW
jgi:hypothetical protein